MASRLIRRKISFPAEIGPITYADPTRCHAEVAIAGTAGVVVVDLDINLDINTA